MVLYPIWSVLLLPNASQVCCWCPPFFFFFFWYTEKDLDTARVLTHLGTTYSEKEGMGKSDNTFDQSLVLNSHLKVPELCNATRTLSIFVLGASQMEKNTSWWRKFSSTLLPRWWQFFCFFFGGLSFRCLNVFPQYFEAKRYDKALMALEAAIPYLSLPEKVHCWVLYISLCSFSTHTLQGNGNSMGVVAQVLRGSRYIVHKMSLFFLSFLFILQIHFPDFRLV